MFNWLTKLLNKPYTDAAAEIETIASEYDPCVGEPVVSFLKSLEADPRRYRGREVTLAQACTAPGFVYHSWMLSLSIRWYSLYDRRTGCTYYARESDRRLKEVYGLPFTLNHWECQALGRALGDHHSKAQSRLLNIASLRHTRERLAKEAAELDKRLEFALQFRD